MFKGFVIRSSVSKEKDFKNRSVNDMMQSVIHFGDDTCRKILSNVCNQDFGNKEFYTTKALCEVLHLKKSQIDHALLGETGAVLRRHMVNSGTRENLWTPRSIIILAMLLHRNSFACRGISVKVASRCVFGTPKVREPVSTAHTTEVVPLPVNAKVQAPHPIPVEAHVVEEPMKASKPNEISVVLQPGTLLRVATAF